MVSRSAATCLHIENHGDQAVVRIAATQFGSVDDEPTGESLISLLGGVNKPLLVLDFANVSFLSSIGLALLVRLHKSLVANGRRLSILNLQPHIYEVFNVTRLNTVLEVR